MDITSFLRHSLATAVVTLAISSSAAYSAEWRGWNIHPEGYPNSVALDQFAADVTKATEGRVSAQVFHNGTLGSQPDAIEQVRNGALQFANFNMGPMGPIIPATNVLSLPFLFKNVDHMHEVMDGEIGNTFSDAMSKEGIVSLAWFDSGSRSFYNTKKPIAEPSDLDGMKFRVMNNNLYVNMVDSLGGNATPMAYGEVYQALNTGVIDGAENNYPSFESSNHFEVAKFYSITEHLIIPECVCIAKAAWDDLSDADKDAVRTAAINAAITQRTLWAQREKDSRAKVEKSGVTINEVKDKAAFQNAMGPVYKGFIEENPDLESLVNSIRGSN